MKSFRVLTPALVAAAALALPVVPTSAAAPVAVASHAAGQASKAKPKYQEYVALGDSWTADVVVLNSDGLPDETYAPIDCAQSHHNHPKIVAATIGAKTFRDASCGSATTDDFTKPQTGLPAGGTNPPQFDRLTKTTDLVTVGIGGNDAGIASAGISCLNVLPVASPIPGDTIPLPPLPIPIIGSTVPLGGCKDHFTKGGTDRLSRRIKQTEIKLVRAFRTIHKISPNARIIAVDYLSLVPDHACYPLVPATDEDMAYIHAKFLELNRMVERAAVRGGAEFVNTYTPTLGHDLCRSATVRYGETFGPSINDPAVGIPAHPNGAGARAQAAVVLTYLRNH